LNLLIQKDCVSCGNCKIECPENAILDNTENKEQDSFFILIDICNLCKKENNEPQCIKVCPVDCIIYQNKENK
jgi:ferredoxin